jgi:tetratricopeptide (TPR) repeat protein
LRATGNERSYTAAETHFGLGVLASYQGRFDVSEQNLQKAVALSASSEQGSPESRARMMDSVARLYTNWGRLRQAEKYQRLAWKAAQSQPNPEPKLMMDLLDSKGTLLFEQAKYAEAERAWKRATDIGS